MQALKSTSRRALIALAAASAVGLGLAQAQTTTPAPAATQPAAMAPAGAQLTIRDIYDRIEAAGYREIREIEWDDGRYEVKALSAQGERVKLHVNGRTGEVEHTRTGK
ncbi:MAG TPA: PepSY domain-containing protein [Ottowia sp.]|uniref:PepSY domain-containing protein n=1 Tax=Ottowia sp. TaxID=1898956 RepID=UPI002CCE9594|nr:PepSY domain-containing protein [Ottowia sp.]HMN21381.1 PepSY domain-containing protein [Ottowia sp.]